MISNVEDALGLEKAKNYGYPALWAQGNDNINDIIAQYEIDIICLAGYLKLYSPPENLKRNVLNIHPSLIPLFCGEGFYGDIVHTAVKKRGCMVSGCTVHFANERFDEGPIVVGCRSCKRPYVNNGPSTTYVFGLCGQHANHDAH